MIKKIFEIYVFVVFFAFIAISCINSKDLGTENQENKTKDHNETNLSLEGFWSTYLPDGEYGPAIEVYEFGSDNRYRMIVTLIPPEPGTRINNGSFMIEGEYEEKGGELYLTGYEGHIKIYDYEIKDDLLALKSGNDPILLLMRVKYLWRSEESK